MSLTSLLLTDRLLNKQNIGMKKKDCAIDNYRIKRPKLKTIDNLKTTTNIVVHHNPIPSLGVTQSHLHLLNQLGLTFCVLLLNK